MDATLKGVVGLITGTDVEARCAALLVLTHLKADDERVEPRRGPLLQPMDGQKLLPRVARR